MTLSGNVPARAFPLANMIPRSVINPVTRRAGVTSKAWFNAGLEAGVRRIVSVRKSSVSPLNLNFLQSIVDMEIDGRGGNRDIKGDAIVLSCQGF